MGSALLVMFFAIVAFTAINWRLSVRGRTWRAAKRAPRATIEKAPNGGAVTIVGTVRYLKAPLVAPISGRRCCYYYATASHESSRLPSEYGGAIISPKVKTEQRGIDFIVEDPTGRALVSVQSDVSIFWAKHPVCNNAPADRVQAFLDQGGAKEPRCEWTPLEWTLAEGDTVAVFGISYWETDPDMDESSRFAGYRSRLARIAIRAPQDLSLLLSDTPEMVMPKT